MTLPWSQKPNFIISFAITLLMTLQISACSTEDFAEAIADNIVSGTSETSNITEITDPAPVSEPVSEPAPEPAISDVSLSWIAPSAREDDNPISLSEIAGYKIYYGTTQGNYNNSVNVNDSAAEGYTLNGLSSGTYYFAVTTKDTEGRESQFSSVVQIVI